MSDKFSCLITYRPNRRTSSSLSYVASASALSLFSSAWTASFLRELMMRSIFFSALSTLSSEYPSRTWMVIRSLDSATPSVPIRCLLTRSFSASFFAVLRTPLGSSMTILVNPST